jgi:hypothetical protein
MRQRRSKVCRRYFAVPRCRTPRVCVTTRHPPLCLRTHVPGWGREHRNLIRFHALASLESRLYRKCTIQRTMLICHPYATRTTESSNSLKTKDGSPAWARTTITVSNVESVSCGQCTGLKCRIGREKPSLVHNSYTAEVAAARHWLPGERLLRRVVGIGSPGEITFAVSFPRGKCFLFNVAMNAARPCSAHEQKALSSGSAGTSSSPRRATNFASSLSRLMISPTRMRRTPSRPRTALYSETISPAK